MIDKKAAKRIGKKKLARRLRANGNGIQPGDAGPNVGTIKSKMTPTDRILELAKASEEPYVHACYQAVIGDELPVGVLLASNRPESEALSVGIASGIHRRLSENPHPVAVRKQQIARVPGSAPGFDVSQIRKAMASRGADMITGFHGYPVPDDSDLSGFSIVVETVGIYFGADAKAAVERSDARNRARHAPGYERAIVIIAEPNDMDAVRNACDALVKPCFSLSPSVERESAIPYPDDWGSGRAKRGFLLLQLYSMLPMKKKLVASGAGKAILTGELALAEHRLAEACKVGPSVIHRDGVPHFWFAELRRLGFDDLSVPLVKLH